MKGIAIGVNNTRLFLLSSWLGAAVFFSVVVAPAVFGTLHAFNVVNANEIAGTIVTRSLAVVNLSGFVISLMALALTIIAERIKHQLSYFPTNAAFLVMAVSTGAGQWVIAAKMRALRVSMAVIDQVPFDDPRRVAFNSLHHYSVILLAAAMCAAIVAMLLTRIRPAK